MTVEYTAGKWGLGDDHEICAHDSDQLNNGYFIAICEGPDKKLNAKRIVACVNACAGMPDSSLDGANLKNQLDRQYNQIVRLTQQRDELLAAINAVLVLKDNNSGRIYRSPTQEQRREKYAAYAALHEAIANAKPSTPDL